MVTGKVVRKIHGYMYTAVAMCFRATPLGTLMYSRAHARLSLGEGVWPGNEANARLCSGGGVQHVGGVLVSLHQMHQH